MIRALTILFGCALVSLGSRASGSQELSAYERQLPRSEVRVYGKAGAETIDLVASRADLDALIRQVALNTQREVRGLDLLSRHPKVTAKVAGENLRDALSWIGGSVGMRITVTTSTIRVEEDLAPYPTRSELFQRAQGGYFRALVDHPASSLAPAAAWNRARIESDQSGRALEAARSYDALAQDYPASDLVADALLEAGINFGRAGAWLEATARFDALVGYKREHPHSVTARRLLADAHTRVAANASNDVVARENARRALFVLEALDDDENLTPPGPNERRLRSIIRSRAYSLAGEPVNALKSLDLAEKYSTRGLADPEIAELRSLAFERAERYGDAVRAWLRYSSLVEGEEHVKGMRNAAIAANAGREHLTAITIAKAAANEGFGDELAPYADAALAALDLDPERIDLFGDPERLALGLQLVEKNLFKQAADALRPVFERRATLTQDELVRLGRGYATALSEDSRIDEAALVLRSIAQALDHASSRKGIYLFASRLLESAGEIDRAIEALGGRL